MRVVVGQLRSGFEDLVSLFVRWHGQPEGKAAIYASLLLCLLPLGNGIAAQLLAPPKVMGPSEQGASAVAIPCRAQERLYAFGVRVLLVYSNGERGTSVLCKDMERGMWISNDPDQKLSGAAG